MARKAFIMRLIGVFIWILISGQVAWAGPPFATDDPEPVEYRHWEIYIASQLNHDKEGWAGTAPHLEVNYGVVPNVQLHLIAPLSFAAPAHEATHFGYGDTELGVKYRFFEETEDLPQIGLFPLIETPTGNRKRGLGSGHVQAFIPLWLQKTFEPWATYGGAGYWINPGKGNLDWWFIGWLLQRDISPELTLGGEIFHETPSEKSGHADSRFNVGGIYNFSSEYHLLFSAGHTIQGPNAFQAYFAFQATFGPEKQAASKN